MYLLPHITPELIVLKHAVECGAPLQDGGATEQNTQTHRGGHGFWTRVMSIFS